MQLLAHHYVGLPCFAGLNALVPRVTKVCVTRTSAVSKPRTAAGATADFARFLSNAALGTHGTDGRRCRDCWCWHVANDQTHTKVENPTNVTIDSERVCVYRHKSLTYVCRPPRLQTNCDRHFCCQHHHNRDTTRRQERNNLLAWIS